MDTDPRLDNAVARVEGYGPGGRWHRMPGSDRMHWGV